MGSAGMFCICSGAKVATSASFVAPPAGAWIEQEATGIPTYAAPNALLLFPIHHHRSVKAVGISPDYSHLVAAKAL